MVIGLLFGFSSACYLTHLLNLRLAEAKGKISRNCNLKPPAVVRALADVKSIVRPQMQSPIDVTIPCDVYYILFRTTDQASHRSSEP